MTEVKMNEEESIADKVMKRLQREGKTPKQFGDEFVELFREYRNKEMHGRKAP